MVLCRVYLLDGKEYQCELDQKATGQAILDRVFEHLNLLEKDYFALTYKNEKNVKCWLSPGKRIDKQIKDKEDCWNFTFEVKFYVPDPLTLHEELTRYMLFLQVRTDILSGKLPCSFVAQALLSSYAVQSQIGDHKEEEHGTDSSYIKNMQFAPGQSDELLEKIAELHKLHKGDTNAETELKYLENAKNLAMYGVHLHPAKNLANEEVNIGVCAIGLLVFKDKLRLARYPWAKQLKFSYKRNTFTIKLRPPENMPPKTEEKVVFKLETVKYAKRLWRLAVEHHTFFRMREADEAERALFSRNNKYYYTGRTEYQTRLAAEQIPRSGNDFNRLSGHAGRPNQPGTLGYTTERTEQRIAEESRTATLSIRQPGAGSRASLHFDPADDQRSHYTYDRNGAEYNLPDQNGNVDLLLGNGGGARYNGYGSRAGSRPTSRPVSRIGTLGGQQQGGGYGQDPAYDTIEFDATRVGNGLEAQNGGWGADGYEPAHGYDNYPNGLRPAPLPPPRRSGRNSAVPDDVGSVAQSTDERLMEQQQPARDQWGNIVVTKNIYINATDRQSRHRRGPGSVQSSQDDYMSERGGRGGDYEEGQWGQEESVSPGGRSRTTTRTYTAPDGTIITEYRTERDGVITTRIEKRTRVMDEAPEDYDYDQALRDAIHAVTDMNPDLDVEKIEIHTKAEERHDDLNNYSLV